MLGFLASSQPIYLRPPADVAIAFRAVRPTARIHVAFHGAVQCRTRSIRHPIDLAYLSGLTAFQQQDWVQAGEIFEALIEGYGADGPAHFYLDLCRRYARTPPKPPWDGAVRL